MAESLEYFRNELLTYYPDYLLHADFTDGGKLILLAKPFVDLDLVMQELCDEMVELVKFQQHLDSGKTSLSKFRLTRLHLDHEW